MNLADFLKEIDPDAGWYFDFPDIASGPIRDSKGQRPLCHVANNVFGTRTFIGVPSFKNIDFNRAADYIGLTRHDRRLLASVSDDIKRFAYFELPPTEERIYFRDELLLACGLKNTS